MLNRAAVALAGAIAASLLVGSVLSADSQNSSSEDSEVPWYQRGPIYQIYPLAFADTDGDGNGDIRGIIEHVSYLKDLGVEAVWMNPVFKSPMKDNGYDCSDYYDINPTFGTLSDVEELIETLHDNDIKILLDFVPNHTSNEHQWFLDSINKTNGKEDWYIWKDPLGYNSSGDPVEPNNWLSPFGGSSWKYNEDRKQFYYHKFGYYQPDLNYSNPDVMDAMQEVMRFWLRKGVDGFRIDAVLYLWENNYDTDEPITENCTATQAFKCQDSIYTMNQPENYGLVKQFNDVLEEDEFKNSSLVNFLEAYTTRNLTLAFYDRQNAPFNFQLLDDIEENSNASVYADAIFSWLDEMPDGQWPNWVAGNHDNERVATRLGEEMVDATNMLVMLLPGLAFSYQGEEIGMPDMDIRDDLQIDVSTYYRDPERTPLQWNTSLNAGFTSARAGFLPVNPNYWRVNIEEQTNATYSHLKIYKSLVQLHKELIDSSKENLTFYILSTYVFAFERPEHFVVINLNQLPESINLTTVTWLPETLYVKIPSMNAGYNVNDTVTKSTNFDMTPRSGIVFWFNSSEVVTEAPSTSTISLETSTGSSGGSKNSSETSTKSSEISGDSESSTASSQTSTSTPSGSGAIRHSVGVLLLGLIYFVAEYL